MRIGLIDPGAKIGQKVPHLGLAYLASRLLSEGHEVLILDMACSTRDEIKKFSILEFDILGVSSTYFSLREVRKILEVFRKPRLMSVLGGPYASTAREEALKETDYDACVYGEGEETFMEMVRALDKSKKAGSSCLKGIAGLIYRSNGRIVSNKARSRIMNLDALPAPAYHLLPMERYEKHVVISSRGCPFNCIFCDKTALWGVEWEGRSPKSVVDEMRFLLENYGKKEIDFLDYCMNADPKHFDRMCAQIRDSLPGIRWNCWGLRAENVSKKTARLMKESGCQIVSVGVESANQKILDNIGKRLSLGSVEKSVRNLKDAGLTVYGMFVIGNPGDNISTVSESVSFAVKNLDYATFYLALPYPRTRLYDYVVKKGVFIAKDLSKKHHFLEEPLFETPDFTKEERIKALKMAKKSLRWMKLAEGIKTIIRSPKMTVHGIRHNVMELIYLFDKDRRLYNAEDILEKMSF